MSPSPAAVAHMEARRRLAEGTARAVRQSWLEVNPSRIYPSWLELMTHVLAMVSGGQLAAAQTTDPWLDALLGAADPERPSADRLNPRALVGVTGDGRPLAEALLAPVWAVLRLVTAGAPVVPALARGQAVLDLLVRTAIADAGRGADSVGMISRPAVTSYVRVVESGACNRCLVLAGREYGVSTGFARHPRCGCTMEPVTKDHRPTPTSVEDVYQKMSAGEKKKAFGEAAVKAIDSGANIAQVVNARRGMTTATAFGRRLQATTEGATRRGVAGKRLKNFHRERRATVSRTPRLMPEEIFRLADNREHAVRLLRQHAYIL